MQPEADPPVTLFCPVCCSTVLSRTLAETTYTCVTCGQAWTMALDSDRATEWSPV